jgi:hypothetical protein
MGNIPLGAQKAHFERVLHKKAQDMKFKGSEGIQIFLQADNYHDVA